MNVKGVSVSFYSRELTLKVRSTLFTTGYLCEVRLGRLSVSSHSTKYLKVLINLSLSSQTIVHNKVY